jgi:hypothetical protein
VSGHEAEQNPSGVKAITHGGVRCDHCGAWQSEWKDKPCVGSVTRAARHSATRFFESMPRAGEGT